jgi:hypothetical protein
MDVGALLAAGRALLEERPRTIAELSKLLAARWPDRDAASLGYAIRYLVPTVQIPPRGLWGRGGLPVCTTAEAWLGRPLAPSRGAAGMIRRYLAAFGPATVRDAQAWSGLANLQPIVDRMRLRVLADDKGRTLYDLPRAPRPAPDTPAPPRFLPDFDNALLAHADRARILPDDDRREQLIGKPTFLVDGFVRGTWKLARLKTRAVLTVTPSERLPRKEVAPLRAEAARLLVFVAPDARAREVRLARG